MKILYVDGADYSAMDFSSYLDDNEMTLQDALDKVESEGIWTYEDDDKYFEVRLKEFGDIDLDFIEFLRNEIIDEDLAKHVDFFVVEEE